MSSGFPSAPFTPTPCRVMGRVHCHTAANSRQQYGGCRALPLSSCTYFPPEARFNRVYQAILSRPPRSRHGTLLVHYTINFQTRSHLALANFHARVKKKKEINKTQASHFIQSADNILTASRTHAHTNKPTTVRSGQCEVEA